MPKHLEPVACITEVSGVRLSLPTPKNKKRGHIYVRNILSRVPNHFPCT